MWPFRAVGGTPIYPEPEVIVAMPSWLWIGRVLSCLDEVAVIIGMAFPWLRRVCRGVGCLLTGSPTIIFVGWRVVAVALPITAAREHRLVHF